MRSWRRFWNKEGWNGALCKRKPCKKEPELVVHERMCQGEGVKGTEETKKVKGWSTVEMKDKPNSLLEEDTEEMRKWKSMSQEERGSSGQVQGRGQQKRG